MSQVQSHWDVPGSIPLGCPGFNPTGMSQVQSHWDVPGSIPLGCPGFNPICVRNFH
ncbi:hypothetical protein DPMN_191610 [Dreissena polymorpha]|uniref:Uncharacterized protein n=1 Tax=Dreissena polymorpha TaxID=45954 RepID=A0A9D4BEF3_DREPO|nr:hypothetical protein DPMN_191610 [Dreissena polymorpha]